MDWRYLGVILGEKSDLAARFGRLYGCCTEVALKKCLHHEGCLWGWKRS